MAMRFRRASQTCKACCKRICGACMSAPARPHACMRAHVRADACVTWYACECARVHRRARVHSSSCMARMCVCVSARTSVWRTNAAHMGRPTYLLGRSEAGAWV